MTRIIFTLGLVVFLFPAAKTNAVHSAEPLNLFEEFDLGPNQSRKLEDHKRAVLVLAQLRVGKDTVETLTFNPIDGGKWDDPQGCVHLRLRYDPTQETLTDDDLTCFGGTSNFAFHVYFLYRR